MKLMSMRAERAKTVALTVIRCSKSPGNDSENNKGSSNASSGGSDFDTRAELEDTGATGKDDFKLTRRRLGVGKSRA